MFGYCPQWDNLGCLMEKDYVSITHILVIKSANSYPNHDQYYIVTIISTAPYIVLYT